MRDTLLAALNRTIDPEQGSLVEGGSGQAWLIRAQSPDLGVFAIDLGSLGPLQAEAIRADIDAAMVDVAATLQRLGLERVISEARSRTESDRLRDALLGSVSHELRTPLASILGAATTLAGRSRAARGKQMPVRAKTTAGRQFAAIRPDEIDRQRQTHVATIRQVRALGAGQNALLEKANSLLTVHWAHASWASRATILKTVDWLLQVALNNPAPKARRGEARG